MYTHTASMSELCGSFPIITMHPSFITMLSNLKHYIWCTVRSLVVIWQPVFVIACYIQYGTIYGVPHMEMLISKWEIDDVVRGATEVDRCVDHFIFIRYSRVQYSGLVSNLIYRTLQNTKYNHMIFVSSILRKYPTGLIIWLAIAARKVYVWYKWTRCRLCMDIIHQSNWMWKHQDVNKGHGYSHDIKRLNNLDCNIQSPSARNYDA